MLKKLKMTKIAIIGEYNKDFGPHIATDCAIAHSNRLLDTNVEGFWITTDKIEPSMFNTFGGIWIALVAPIKI